METMIYYLNIGINDGSIIYNWNATNTRMSIVDLAVVVQGC